MASTINADKGLVTGITGIVQTADNTGNLTLQANGVSVLTIDTSNTLAVTGLVSATGNITGGNILTVGIMSSTGNAIYGNILTVGLISATSTITSAANVIGGNITTVGLITATGNVTGGNIQTAGLITATGNVTGGNIRTVGVVSATGNINAGNISVVGALSTAAKGITAASLPTGSVLQVAWTNWTGGYTATSATNVDFTGFSATFTPLYATSKVLIIVSAGVNFICDGVVYIKRNGTIVKDTWFGSSRQDDQYDYPQATQTYLDSPATTSTITYQMGGRAPGCAGTIRFGASDNSSSILFMEIAA